MIRAIFDGVDREAQIAYAAVGLEAPFEVKKAWDPDQAKRKKLLWTIPVPGTTTGGSSSSR